MGFESLCACADHAVLLETGNCNVSGNGNVSEGSPFRTRAVVVVED